MTSPIRARFRRIAVIGALVGLVLAALVAAAPLVISGHRLGRVVGWMLPPLRGQVRVGGGTWTWAAVWAVARGRPGAIALDDVLIIDPDGERVFQARHLATAIQVDRQTSAVVLHDLRVTDAFWRMARTKDLRGIGFLTAFQRPAVPKLATASPASAATPALSFRIAKAQLQNLDAEFDLPGWALTLRQVAVARGQLAVSSAAHGPTAFTFEALDADARGGGMVAVIVGGRRLVLPFSSTLLARVATTAAAPDAIELDARAIKTGRSVSTLKGRFAGVFGPGTGPPSAELAVTIAHAADAVTAVAAGHPESAELTVDGEGAGLDFALSGPLAAPLIVADAHGFDLRFRGLLFNRTGFHLDSQPAARRIRLTTLAFDSPAGGRITVDGSLDRRLAGCRLGFDGFNVGPYLPAPLLPFAGGTLDGHLRAEVDLGRPMARIDDTDLVVTRPPHVAGPPVVRLVSATGPRASGRAVKRGAALRFAPTFLRDGTLTLPRITAALWGGRVTARGRIRLWDPLTSDWMPSPWFVLKVDAERIAFERIVGSDFAVGTVSLRAQARGTLQSLTLEASFAPHQRVRILGDSFSLPSTITASLDTARLEVAPLILHGQSGSALGARGRIELSGALALAVDVMGFPLRKLPGLSDIELPLDGQVQGQLRLSGTRGAPAVAGQLAIVDAHFQGRPIGGGTLTVSPIAQGGIRGRGQVIEGMMADGTLVPARGGVKGDVALTLRRLRLDPFLGGLPGGAAAAGIVSGVVTAHVAPAEPPSIDGRLSELTLLVTGPPLWAPGTATGTARPSVDFHSEGEVRVTAQARGGAMTLAPARFKGRAGTLELAGETKRGDAKGRVRAHLDLNELGELAKPWVERLGGAVDFEAEGSLDAAGLHPFLRGSIAVTSQARLRLRNLPIDASVAPGRIALTEVGATTRDLSVTLGRDTLLISGQLTRARNETPRLAVDLRGALDPRLVEPFARKVVRDIDGRLGLNAYIDGPVAAPRVRAHLDLGGTTFTLVEGAQRFSVPRGELSVDLNATERQVELRDLELRMGSQVRMILGGAAPSTAGTLAGHGTGQVGKLRLAREDLFRIIAVDLPARGTVHALPTPDVIIDDATFSLRLAGAPERRLVLSGEVEVAAAHVPEELRNRKKTLSRPALSRSPARVAMDRTQLDVHIHSRKGAVIVELDHAPDLTADVDLKIGGSVAQPRTEGKLKPAGVYSRIVMFVGELFR